MTVTVDSAYLSQPTGLNGHVKGLRIVFDAGDVGTWKTIAQADSQQTGLRIEGISGHNSGVTHYGGNVSTYTYNVSNGTTRTVWAGGTSPGNTSCRLLVNGSPSQWFLQVKLNAAYGTGLHLFIGAGLKTIETGTM